MPKDNFIGTKMENKREGGGQNMANWTGRMAINA